MVRSIFGKAKKTFIMENKQINDLKRAEFWHFSNGYQIAYDAMSPEQLKIIKQYAINYNPSGETTVVKLAAQMIGSGEKYHRFYKGYFSGFNEKSHFYFKYQ
jgi:hypothetical protein